MDKGKKINWKNGLLLSAVSYLLYIIIWLVLDYETARQLPVQSLLCQGHRICLVPADAQQSGGFRYDLTF